MAMVLGTSCADKYELDAPDVSPDDLVQGVAFTVTPDAQNPNLIHLKSQMPSNYQVYWQHGQGQSEKPELDLKCAFPGEQTVTFGVITRGGLVMGQPYTFNIEDMCADFITGEMWENLTGGGGNSKTWVPDNGNYGKKQGYYSCFDPSATHTDFGSKTWWEPSDSDVGNTEDDLKAEMTFSLQGGAKLTTTTYVDGVPTTKEGTFDMNPDAWTMAANGVDFLHAAWTDGKAKDFRNGYVILYLDENQLMIANHRDPVLSNEGDCLYCFNFVSKEYAESYVPPTVEVVPEPELDSEWYNLLLTQNRYCTWSIDADKPYEWCDLYGNKTKDGENFVEATVNINLDTDAPGLFTTTVGEVETNGKYNLSQSGFLSFDTPIGSTALSPDVDFALNDDNTLRVLRYEKDDLGRVSDLYLGRLVKDFSGKPVQYVAYHFVAQFGGSSAPKFKLQLCYNNTTSWTMIEGAPLYIEGDGTYTLSVTGSNSENDPCLWVDLYKVLPKFPNCDIVIKEIKIDGNSIAFDDNAISRKPADENNPVDARRYIYNPWGPASCFPNKEVFLFNNEITVTVDVKFDNGQPFERPE